MKIVAARAAIVFALLAGLPVGAAHAVTIGGIDLGSAIGALAKAGSGLRDVPEDEEILMGRSIAGGLLGAAPLVDNPAQQRYVNDLGRWIALNSGRPDLPWKFGILDTASVNAFATPGGYVFVTRGLVARTRSESELAGVLAHEIAHVVLKHHLADIKKQAGKELAIDFASMKAPGGLQGEAAKGLARVGLEGYARGLSREDELEADRLGVLIAARAGYEPYGLPAVLQALAAMPQDDSALGLFLKTHPSPSDRLAALEGAMPDSYAALAVPNPKLARFDTVFVVAVAPSPASAGTAPKGGAPAKDAKGNPR